MERHFACTACGKCCHGWLPLTVSDALAHAGRFPLAMIWTPVRQSSRAFALTERLGMTIRTRHKKTLAVRMVPTAYLPPDMACPALTGDNLCGVQAEKPLRCRAMPFFPYRDETDQADLLFPRPTWQCDIGPTAPVVYRDKEICQRDDFDAERSELLAQAAQLRQYGEWVLQTSPMMVDNLTQAANSPGGGHVAVSFASLLRHLPNVDRSAVAAQQMHVLLRYQTPVMDHRGGADYARHYRDWSLDMERLL